MALLRKSFIVYGRVQGVAYRANTHRKAIQLGVTGIVRNQTDGSVYVEAQGTASQIALLYNWLQVGPAMARVEQIETYTLSLVDGEESFGAQW